MRIGQPEPAKKRRLKPPPDYTSRRMQWRLLLAVVSRMLIAILAGEVRNPDRWKWLANLDQIGAPSDELVDPRLQPARQEEAEEVVVNDRLRPKVKIAEGDDVSALDRAWASGWEETFTRLSNQDRQMIYDLLKAGRDQTDLRSTDTELASEAIGRLDQLWAEYRATAKSGVERLDEGKQSAWTPVLEQLELRWTVNTKPLLMMLVQREKLDDEQREQLFGVQDLLDHLELKAIQDNTPWRSSEREIWFRLLGKLQKRTRQELRGQSTGPISYSQLFKQAENYRGKLITVRGTAEDVYWVQAPPNSYGIEKYWVYWLRPEGGANSPILVYALDKPKDFPFVDIADLGRGKMPAKEDVEFTGFFFKRWAYQGKGGIYTAPMLLAREPKRLVSQMGSRPRELPSAGTFLAVAGVLALLAVGLATVVYYQYRPRRSADADLPATIVIKSE